MIGYKKFELPQLTVYPADWPKPGLTLKPGDLTRFAPQGTGVYGYQAPAGATPFVAAPPHEDCGGLVFFGNDVVADDFHGMLRLLGISGKWKGADKYAVFTTTASVPGAEGYLAQMRIVSDFALQFMYRALNEQETEQLPLQSIPWDQALWHFIEQEKERFGTSFGECRQNRLEGVFGGDGERACEELSFGLMLENSYHHVFRIWSRAWLVTK